MSNGETITVKLPGKAVDEIALDSPGAGEPGGMFGGADTLDVTRKRYGRGFRYTVTADLRTAYSIYTDAVERGNAGGLWCPASARAACRKAADRIGSALAEAIGRHPAKIEADWTVEILRKFSGGDSEDSSDNSGDDSEAEKLREYVTTILTLTAEEYGLPLRPGRDYRVEIKDCKSYSGKAWPAHSRTGRKIFISSRYNSPESESALLTVVHELAHLLAFSRGDYGHGAGFQHAETELLAVWGYTPEYTRTPGYARRIVRDRDGETVEERYTRDRSGPDLDGWNVTRHRAGHYTLTDPDGIEYHVRKLNTFGSRDLWKVSEAGTDWDRVARRLKDCKRAASKRCQERRDERDTERVRAAASAAENGAALPAPDSDSGDLPEPGIHHDGNGDAYYVLPADVDSVTVELRGHGERTFPIEERDGKRFAPVRCGRCSGRGYYPTRQHGTCFRCNGSRVERVRVWTPEARAKRDRKNRRARERRREREREEIETRKREARERFPDVVDTLERVREIVEEIRADVDPDNVLGASQIHRAIENRDDSPPEFLRDVAQSFHGSGKLTAAQADAVPEAWTRWRERVEERKNREPVPTGRVEITGEIIKVETRENRWGTRDVMTVKLPGGGAVWGTIPKALYVEWDLPEPGTVVTFTATVERADDSESFGFFQRPASAEIVERADG